MKTRLFFTLFAFIAIADSALCQDTSQNQSITREHTYDVTTPSNNYPSSSRSPHVYRDTRLGSSSPLYNTYKKNDYGAGAITNNPNKSSGGISQYPFTPDTSTRIHVYRDTRLGSSSPLYNTYKKNDYGAGAVTTNPNKGSGSAPPSPAADTTSGR